MENKSDVTTRKDMAIRIPGDCRHNLMLIMSALQIRDDKKYTQAETVSVLVADGVKKYLQGK